MSRLGTLAGKLRASPLAAGKLVVSLVILAGALGEVASVATAIKKAEAPREYEIFLVKRDNAIKLVTQLRDGEKPILKLKQLGISPDDALQQASIAHGNTLRAVEFV
jgi:hypothetical protein